MRLSFAAPVLKGGHEVIVELRDHNAVGEKGASAPEPPRRAHHASTQPVGKGLVMKKILSLTFVAMLSVALAAPAYAGRGYGGGFHGGHHGGFHHGGGFHGGCCWGGSLRRRGLRGLGVRVSVLRLCVLRLSVRLPHVCGAGLPAADAGDRGAVRSAGRLLHRRLLPFARRWSDGR